MRVSRPNVRKVSNRRPHRPDQRVYRSLRLARRRREAGAWVALAAGVGLAVAAAGAWWVSR